MRALAALSCWLAIACGASSEPLAISLPTSALIAARPYSSHVPSSYDAGQPTPLVILLHGYGQSGAQVEQSFDLFAAADAAGFLVATPDGTSSSVGKRFWNATDACCNFDDEPIDDVAYLNAVLDDMAARYNVDAGRVYLVGHSNGGFMAYRFACDRGARVAGIVVVAGAMWQDVASCPAAAPVPVLHVHGEADGVIGYEGHDAVDDGIDHYPSAKQSVADWAAIDGCGGLVETDETLDLVVGPGRETTVARHAGCPQGLGVELWTMRQGSHLPSFAPAWAPQISAWLLQWRR